MTRTRLSSTLVPALGVALAALAIGAAPASATTLTLSNIQVDSTTGADEGLRWSIDEYAEPSYTLEFTTQGQNRQSGPWNFELASFGPQDAASLADNDDAFTMSYDLTYAGETIHRVVTYRVDALYNDLAPGGIPGVFLAVSTSAGNGAVTFSDGTRFMLSHVNFAGATFWGFGTSAVSITLQTPASSVPEPGTVALAVAGATAVARGAGRRRGRR